MFFKENFEVFSIKKCFSSSSATLQLWLHTLKKLNNQGQQYIFQSYNYCNIPNPVRSHVFSVTAALTDHLCVCCSRTAQTAGNLKAKSYCVKGCAGFWSKINVKTNTNAILKPLSYRQTLRSYIYIIIILTYYPQINPQCSFLLGKTFCS